MGLIGAAVLIAIYGILIIRLLKISLSSGTNFPRLLSLGFLTLLVSQIFINIGMNLGILPVIGVPLPFVSYGGSSLISLFLGLGILQSVIAHKT